MSIVGTLQFQKIGRGLHTVNLPDDLPVTDFISWWDDNGSSVDSAIEKLGAVLIRNAAVHTPEDFNLVAEKCFTNTIDYIDGNSPRRKLTSRVYTSTEYDATEYITMHNELSYSSKWPSRIMFCCIVPAQAGGETPIADGREILQLMDPEIVAEIKKRGVMYIRNLHGGNGIGPSWQSTFETTDRDVIASYCAEREIQYEWRKENSLRLLNVRPGIITHSITKEEVWFNQIDQFHPAHLRAELYEALRVMYDSDDEIPTFVKFGDGTPIPPEYVATIQEVTRAQAITFTWQSGDVLLLDNVLYCHGRNPYSGDRRILVSMA